MNKKELIAKILEKLSEEELKQLIGEEEKEEEQHRHVIKRRGSGYNKKKKKSKNNQTAQPNKYSKKTPMKIGKRKNKFEDFMKNISLDATEQKELAKASKEDEVSRKNTQPKRKGKRPSTLIDVRCSTCLKDFNVSRNLVGSVERWKCNSCCCQGR